MNPGLCPHGLVRASTSLESLNAIAGSRRSRLGLAGLKLKLNPGTWIGAKPV